MRHRVPPIARVRLARSLPRLLAWPAIVIATGAMAVGSWFLGSFGSGTGGLVFAILGGILIVIGLVTAVLLLSVRLEVHEAAVRLSWLGGERMYALVRGPVTRVRLRGRESSRLRPRIGFFGWAIGAARLREDEEIQVVRLARTPTAILVPTERGRLAIAAAEEGRLLDALSRAARARQRLEDIADAPRPAQLPAPAEPEAADEAPEPAAVATPVEVAPRVLTGIERALLEQRLAQERAAADEAATLAAGATEAADVAGATDADEAEARAEPVAAADRARLALRRPKPSAAFVLLPLVGAGAAWGLGVLTGTYPEPGTDDGRLTALALVLAGPATSVGAIMARAWWPRLVGIVVSGGLAASAFIARGLLG